MSVSESGPLCIRPGAHVKDREGKAPRRAAKGP